MINKTRITTMDMGNCVCSCRGYKIYKDISVIQVMYLET